MTVYVAMLRGINVSGRNRLPMDDLRKLVTAAGGTHVRTYIQSGNAVFTSTHRAPDLVTALERRLRGVLEAAVPVLVRSQKELDAVMAKNPFVADGIDARFLHVTFMATAPRAADIKAAQAKDVGGDEFEVIRREVYLHCPNGYGNSKLTNAFFEKRFGSEATTRNWKTVTMLAAMTQEV